MGVPCVNLQAGVYATVHALLRGVEDSFLDQFPDDQASGPGEQCRFIVENGCEHACSQCGGVVFHHLVY